MKDFKEECWILYGFRIKFKEIAKKFFIGFQKYHSIGTSSNVVMDYKVVNSPYVIGWYHTHPGISNTIPSSTDNSTMRSWVKSIYKSYLCGIRCGAHDACYYYYVGGISKQNVTIVKKKVVFIKFFGSFFFGCVDDS